MTSSNTVGAAACVGAGVGPTAISDLWGVSKAYTTRVGSGPFPTELHDQTGELLREKGGEFGATTGRARRCGWLDLVGLKHAVRVNGLTGLIITKLDVLSGFEKIKVCTAYEWKNQKIQSIPFSVEDLEQVKPLYKEFKGWSEDLTKIRTYRKLPSTVQKYLKFIEDYLEIPLVMISLGPSREQCIQLKNPF